jgi:hypothetical protein
VGQRRNRQWCRSFQDGKIARIRQDSPDRKQGIENIKEIILIVPGFIANFTKKSISAASWHSSVIKGKPEPAA